MKLVSGHASANPKVEMIECHSANGDHSLTSLRKRIGHLCLLETLDAAVFSN